MFPPPPVVHGRREVFGLCGQISHFGFLQDSGVLNSAFSVLTETGIRLENYNFAIWSSFVPQAIGSKVCGVFELEARIFISLCEPINRQFAPRCEWGGGHGEHWKLLCFGLT